MIRGRGGMGIAKHRKSGHPGKSPKLRHGMRRDAEANDRPARRTTTEWAKSVREALRRGVS